MVSTTFYKWDQAFRVFCMIYTEVHAHRAPEMLQYSHVIHHANRLFIRENVYAYDMDFRIHMAKHPNRRWGIILQQAWSMHLQDRVMRLPNTNNNYNRASNGYDNQLGGVSGGGRKKKICWDYNSGNCTYSFSCKFDHRCGICGKLGHRAHICQKVKQNRRSYSG